MLTEMEPRIIAGTAVGAADFERAGRSWLAARKISAETLAKLPVAFGMVFFPELGRKSNAAFFKYQNGWKARSITDKAFVSGGNFQLSFWNLESVLKENPKTVYITEGELDACALVEAGIPPGSVLSVPNGAKIKPAESPKDQRGYGYVEQALVAGLNRVERFVWCGDSDESGHALRADMVRLFGAAKFWFLDWPEGCKDANDVLRTDGRQELLDRALHGSLPWPVEGMYTLFQIPEPPPLTLWSPGFPEWESKIMLAPRTLSVVTGHPGHGKTVLWQQIWYQVIKNYSVIGCFASFETRARPHIRQQLRSLISGKLERDMSDDEKAKADEWINDRYLFLMHPQECPTLEWFLELAEVAVIRNGARIIQVDPWNRFESVRAREETETEYIGRCLKTLHVFAHDLNCHVQIIAHPAKMDGKRRGEAPGLEDCSGSKNWENMVDQGFVVYRPKLFDGGMRKTEAVLLHKKSRFSELGYPCQLNLNYNILNGKYVSTDYEGY